MPFVQAARERALGGGPLPFDEAAVLRDHAPYLLHTLDVSAGPGTVTRSTGDP